MSGLFYSFRDYVVTDSININDTHLNSKDNSDSGSNTKCLIINGKNNAKIIRWFIDNDLN